VVAAFGIVERRSWGMCITETHRMHVVLFGMQNGTFGPYLAAINRVLVSVMAHMPDVVCRLRSVVHHDAAAAG
jgi:hypothetical protein